MGIAIVPLSEADPASVRQLLARCWDVDWSEELMRAYFTWRYGGRGSGETLLACDRGRCIGILDSFIRRYWIAGRTESVRETCDWFCLPEYRALGVGLHLMRRMMAKPEPILSIGGTETTLDLLPRLKWARLLDVEKFTLPISIRMAAGLVAHRLWRRGDALARIIPDWHLFPRTHREPPPSANAHVQCGAGDQAPRAIPYDLAPWLDTSLLNWLAGAPRVLGEFILLTFFSGDEPVGISISRLQTRTSGYKAQIVHIHAARFALVDWIVSETVHHLLERGVGAVSSATSCLTTGRSLSVLGFVQLRPTPVYWWPPTRLPPSGAFNLTSLRADDALQFG